MMSMLGAKVMILLAEGPSPSASPTPSPSPTPADPGSGGVCPSAPPGVQTYADQILSWVKWGVLAIMAISFFASVGMLIWGKVTHHPKGARLGFDGLIVCLLGAIIYIAGYVIITSITKSGC
jgi:hypothetical protein